MSLFEVGIGCGFTARANSSLYSARLLLLVSIARGVVLPDRGARGATGIVISVVLGTEWKAGIARRANRHGFRWFFGSSRSSVYKELHRHDRRLTQGMKTAKNSTSLLRVEAAAFFGLV
jgi:hypothetical protein